MALSPTTADPVRWLTADEQAAWRSFVTGARRLMDQLEQDLKDHGSGLSHDDYGVLAALSDAEDGRLRMSDLAVRAVESRSRLSHHVGRMEERGLIRRESCPNDRRGSFAVMTETGRALMDATAPGHVAAVRTGFLDHLERGELDVIGAVFARIDDALTGDGDTPDTAEASDGCTGDAPPD